MEIVHLGRLWILKVSLSRALSSIYLFKKSVPLDGGLLRVRPNKARFAIKKHILKATLKLYGPLSPSRTRIL